MGLTDLHRVQTACKDADVLKAYLGGDFTCTREKTAVSLRTSAGHNLCSTAKLQFVLC